MDKLDKIKERLSEISITMSRVPSETKRDFISLANAEFCGDYGMVLKALLEGYLEYQVVKYSILEKMENMGNKLDLIFEKLNVSKEEKEKPKRLGPRIEVEGGNK